MIAAPVDLLVIGGLTIDRFADGSSSAGGSVVHTARAVAPRGIRVAVLTVAGPEPEARAALDELRELVVALEVADADATATFRHHHSAEGRTLWLERRGARLTIGQSRLIARANRVLVAPIAGEVMVEDLPSLDRVPIHAAIVQGWLRSLDVGAAVRPLPMAALGAPVVEALAQFDLLVASREDLLAESDDPRAQLRALRRTVGMHPALVVTDGTDGLWLDAQRATRHLPVPRRIDPVSTVGAGDILAALLALRAGDPQDDLDARAVHAMRVVGEILEERPR